MILSTYLILKIEEGIIKVQNIQNQNRFQSKAVVKNSNNNSVGQNQQLSFGRAPKGKLLFLAALMAIVSAFSTSCKKAPEAIVKQIKNEKLVQPAVLNFLDSVVKANPVDKGKRNSAIQIPLDNKMNLREFKQAITETGTSSGANLYVREVSADFHGKKVLVLGSSDFNN